MTFTDAVNVNTALKQYLSLLFFLIFQIEFIIKVQSYLVQYILDRHQVWRSHDPMLVQTFDFCGKKDVIPPFLKKTQLFVLCIYFFTSFKKMELHCPVILNPVILISIICPVIWCFPIWLTSSLSYQMAIFSANEIRTFIHRNCLTFKETMAIVLQYY